MSGSTRVDLTYADHEGAVSSYGRYVEPENARRATAARWQATRLYQLKYGPFEVPNRQQPALARE